MPVQCITVELSLPSLFIAVYGEFLWLFGLGMEFSSLLTNKYMNPMTTFHEPIDSLSNLSRDHTRALHSLKEEIEAVDWYNQRMQNCSNAELKKILEHNMLEEMEHAVMMLEWLRKNMDGWEENLRTYLFKK